MSMDRYKAIYPDKKEDKKDDIKEDKKEVKEELEVDGDK